MRLGRIDKGIKDACSKVGTASPNAERPRSLGNIGTKKELDEHAAIMKKFPNMKHDETNMAHVDPGKKADLVWTFNRAGEFDFACLLPGHYEAGMRGKVNVAKK